MQIESLNNLLYTQVIFDVTYNSNLSLEYDHMNIAKKKEETRYLS